MTGLDTNVLVRFLVGDDERQCALAAAVIRESGTCYIDGIVLCELVWVLESAYGYGREVIADVLEKVLAVRQFTIGQKDLAYLAVKDYRNGKADFADHLIGRINRAAGCSVTVTLDKALKSDPHFKLLG
jgi:predicted nucleic-acid-binding protein